MVKKRKRPSVEGAHRGIPWAQHPSPEKAGRGKQTASSGPVVGAPSNNGCKGSRETQDQPADSSVLAQGGITLVGELPAKKRGANSTERRTRGRRDLRKVNSGTGQGRASTDNEFEGRSLSEASRDEAELSESDEEERALVEDSMGKDGWYGPRLDSPPYTVFVHRAGKVKHIGDSVALVAGLEVGERLTFLGAFRLRCGHGRAEISGYTLRPGPRGGYLEAHSPRWMGLLVINAVDPSTTSPADKQTAAESVANDETVFLLENEVVEAVAQMSEEFPTVLVFRPVPRGRLTPLSAKADADALYSADIDRQGEGSRLSRPGGLLDGDSVKIASQLRLPGMQVVMSEMTGLRPCATPAGWLEAVGAVLNAPCEPSRGLVLVCGPKGVGKSTFCRLLVNRMLSEHGRVTYIDCDLGQPEFTAPGLVSFHVLDSPVLGPPHANLRRPELAYFVGTTTSKPEPMRYSAAVRELVEHYARGNASASPGSASVPFPPLVVNTDGWVRGFGKDLLGAVIDIVRPLHVVQIRRKTGSRRHDLERLPPDCRLHRVTAYAAPPLPLKAPPPPPRPKSSDLHTLRLLAYFLGAGGGSRAAAEALPPPVSDAAAPDQSDNIVRAGILRDRGHEMAALLEAMIPRRVPWGRVRVGILSGQVAPDLVLDAINGSVVGLLSTAATTSGLGRGSGDQCPVPGELACVAEAPLAPCLGLALVRSVDVPRRELYVLTPEPIERLKGVDMLVRGAVQLPNEVLYDPHMCCCPYFSAEGVGGEVQLVRKFQVGVAQRKRGSRE